MIDSFTLNDERDMSLRLELTYIGEGLTGDYDPDDHCDVPLLRFYIQRYVGEGEWSDIEGGSYCTLIPADITDVQCLQVSMSIFNMIRGKTDEEIRHIAAGLTEMSLSYP